MTKTEQIKFLEDILTRAKEVYYGSDKGEYMTVTKAEVITIETVFDVACPASMKMNNRVFDFLEDKLRELKPSSNVLKQIGMAVKYTKDKVPLPHPLPSLDKMKPGTGQVDAWLAQQDAPHYVLSDKEDGVGVLILADKKGKPVQMFKAYDNVTGIDITHLMPLFKGIPEKTKFRAIRCEVVMPEQLFQQNWSIPVLGKKDGYENARNLVSGVVNKLNGLHKAAGDVDVVVVGVLDPIGIPSEQFAALKHEGWNVVPHSRVGATNDATLSELLQKRKKKSRYAIDGIVVVTDTYNDLTIGNPDWGRAFKETTDEDIVQVKVVEVHWELSKDAYAKPRVEIEPVRLAGVTVTFCTGFNGFFISNGYSIDTHNAYLRAKKKAMKDGTKPPPPPVKKPIGPGALIRITRSGDVIPDIQEVVEGVKKPQMPDFEWEWNESGVDIVATNPHEHDIIAVKRMALFFRNLGTEGIDEGIMARCYAAGFQSFDAVLDMTYEDWLTVDGVKEKTAMKMFMQVGDCLSDVYLPSLADATGFFGRGFGTTRFEQVMAEFPEVFDLAYPELWDEPVLDIVRRIHGFGGEGIMAAKFVNGLPLLVEWLDTRTVTFAEPEEVEIEGSTFDGKVVCFTGFRSDDWATLIEKQGGTMSDFGSKVNVLVWGGKRSTKVDKALDKGMTVMTQDEFTAFLKKHKLA